MTIKKEIMTSFSAEDNKSFEPEMKVGLLATVNSQGQPHITILSTLQARKPQEMFFGQFAEGMSKENIRKNPKVGFLIMTLDKNFWRGKARFTHTASQGEEYDLLNNTPMFRYNSYFGIHTVFYMDLIEQYGKTPLPMSKVILGAVKTIVVKTIAPIKAGKTVLNEWTRKLIDKMDNLKFLCYVGADGYPQIIPVIQSQTSGNENVLFSTSTFGEELTQIPKGAIVAFFCMSFSMETVLLRGVYQGISRRAGLECGGLLVNWVYSCMPPKSMQIYPELPIETIREF